MINLKCLILLTGIGVSTNYSNASINKGEYLSIDEIDQSVLERSYELKAKKYHVESAKEKRESLPSSFAPKLTLDGSYKYISEVPEINMAPGRTLKFGDNKNYTFGPTLTLTLFDNSAKTHLQKSFDKILNSKENEEKSLRSTTLYKARFHYLSLVLLAEKKNLVSESLTVAKKQLKDVSEKKRLGAGSKLDLLTAQKEVHELETQEMELNYNIIEGKTELFKISQNEKLKKETQLTLAPLETLEQRFAKYEHYRFEGISNSNIKSLNDLAESFEVQAKSINSSKFPKVTLFARTSYDYPNGPNLEQFNQNAVGLNFSMPIYDGGEINHSASEKKLQAQSLKLQALNAESNLSESTLLLISRIKNLKEQNAIIKKKINEASQIAQLIYGSYIEGRSTFLEVERANFKYREAKLSLSLNYYNTVSNLINLAALAGE